MPNAPTDLPENDRALIKAVREGGIWYAGDVTPTPAQLADPVFVETMPIIRASTVRSLCLGLWNDVLADPRGVEICGARIVGEFDMSFGTGQVPVSLRQCHIEQKLNVRHARFPALYLSGSHLALGLGGDGLNLRGNLFCRAGFTSKGAVCLPGARIGGAADFSGAALDGSGAAALNADGIQVTGDLFCRDGFTSKGPVRLLGARIGGTADFISARLDGNGGAALNADGIQVTGSLLCRGGFTSKGEVRLPGARIGGTAEFDGAMLDGNGGVALSGDGIQVTRALFCRAGFTSKGMVRFPGAQIGSNAEFDNAKLDGNGGAALVSDHMDVVANLLCRGGFTSKGEVRLLGASIGGNAEFNGAMLDGGGAAALNADGIRVKGGLYCRYFYTNNGVTRLLGARIGGNVEFDGAMLDGNGGIALQADNMQVTGDLFCRDGFKMNGDVVLSSARIDGLLDWRPSGWTGVLNLSHVSTGQWWDAWDGKGWSCTGAGRIFLNHFTYDAFFADEAMKTDSTTRIAWIQAAQGDDFRPGPYHTLARVLRAAGDDAGTVAVGLAKEQARSKHRIKSYRKRPGKWNACFWWAKAAWVWFWTRLFDLFVGYGYRPWRGVGWLVILLAIGTLLFGWGAPTPYGGPGLIKPADPVFISANQTRSILNPLPAPAPPHGINYTLPPEYTPFSAFWYSFDTLVPLIDLGQERAWSPSPIDTLQKDKAGWWLLFYLYIHIIMGWVLTTLTVVALTGLIKRDKEAE